MQAHERKGRLRRRTAVNAAMKGRFAGVRQ